MQNRSYFEGKTADSIDRLPRPGSADEESSSHASPLIDPSTIIKVYNTTDTGTSSNNKPRALGDMQLKRYLDVELGSTPPSSVATPGKDEYGQNTRGEEFVQQAINMAGEDSFGIIAIDLWILNEKDNKLHHFSDGGGLNWTSHIFKRQLEDDKKMDALNALDELNHDIENDEICGAGLAGNLWQLYGASATVAISNHDKKLEWHDLREFTTNPFQMPSTRLRSLAKVFGKATGIPFNLFGRFKGVVVYFARKNFNESGVNSDINTRFLRESALQIGLAAAMVETRARSIKEKKENVEITMRKVRFRIRLALKMQKLPTQIAMKLVDRSFHGSNKEMKSRSATLQVLNSSFRGVKIKAQNIGRIVNMKTKSLVEKSLNPPLQAPPGTSFYIAAWTTAVCFIAFMVILGINEMIRNASNNDFGIILGPFGALITLQYALTAAPPSQPRNSLFGMITCLVVPMTTKFLLHDLFEMPQWIVSSFGTSLAIGVMCKTGIVHPPAGATAIVVSMSKNRIETDLMLAGIMLGADLVAIVMAILMNNISDTRQYPMYPMWHLGVPPKSFSSRKKIDMNEVILCE